MKKTVQLIAISHHVTQKMMRNAEKNLKLLGFDLVMDPSIKDRFLVYAGSKSRQAREINSAFSNEKIDAIFCVTGGNGAIRILPEMDFDLIQKNRKPIMGYSDNTSILNVISQRCDMVTIHGPHQTTNWSNSTKVEKKALTSCLKGEDYSLNIPKNGIILNPHKEGLISGKTVGGCFRPLYDVMNTPYKINMRNKILFLEFVDLKGSRIYTWLSVWEINNIFKDVKAIVLGDFVRCEAGLKYVTEFFKNKKIPLINLKNFGHSNKNVAFPIGAKCEIDLDCKKISFNFKK